MPTRAPRKKAAPKTQLPLATDPAPPTSTEPVTEVEPIVIPAQLSDLEVSKAIDKVRVAVSTVTAKVPASVSTPEEFTAAEKILVEITAAETKIEDGFSFIKPYRSFLDGIYAVRRGLARPLADAVTRIKRVMADYELARIKKEREEQAVKDKIEQDRQAAINLQLAQQRENDIFEQQLRAAAAQEQGDSPGAAAALSAAQAIAAAPAAIPISITTAIETSASLPAAPPPPRSTSSIPVHKYRITDFSLFVVGIVGGMIPEKDGSGNYLLNINSDIVQGFMTGEGYKDMANWPGVEVYEDVSIRR